MSNTWFAKFLRLGCDNPVIGKIFERCLNFDFNLLTLRIGPFGVDQKNFHFFVPSMVRPGCCRGTPIHEFSRSCLTSLNDENIRYLILSSQYSCIALLRHRLHDPSWALPAGVQKWRYSRNHGFTRFHGKSGSVSFFLLSMCNFMQKIKKILRAVLEKNDQPPN